MKNTKPIVIALVVVAIVVLMVASYLRAQKSITLSVCVDHQFKLAETKKNMAMKHDLKPGDKVTQEMIDSWLSPFYTDGTWDSFQCRSLKKGQYFFVGKVGEETRCPVHGTFEEVRALMTNR